MKHGELKIEVANKFNDDRKSEKSYIKLKKFLLI